MGLSVFVYRSDLGDCTNGGASAAARAICIVNIPGPFRPGPDRPAFELIQGPGGKGHAVLVPVQGKDGIGPMAGGNFAYCSDSRFSQAVRELTGSNHYGAVAIHDRYESPELHHQLSI